MEKLEKAIDILMEDYYWCDECQEWYKGDREDERYHLECKHY